MLQRARRETTTSRASPAAEAGATSAVVSAGGAGGIGRWGEEREEQAGRGSSLVVGAAAAAPAAAVFSGCVRTGVVAARAWRKLAGEGGPLRRLVLLCLIFLCNLRDAKSRRLKENVALEPP